VSSQMEPSPEVAQFLQEIAAHKQHANLRKLGGFSQASATGEEEYSEQVMAVPGSTIVTEVWMKSEKGIWTTSKTAKSGFTRYFSRWRFPTVSLWKRLGSSRQNIFIQEKKVWRVFLTETSLIQKPLTFFEGCLSDESFQDVMNFSPAMIPTALVRMFLKTTSLSRQELFQIEQECMEIWRKEGGSVRDPHPLFEEVITAMNLHERFGITAWKSFDDIPIRTYTVMRKVIECYNIAQDLNQKEEHVREKAAKMAGVRRPGMIQ
jgi:hypothetical protein